MKNKSLICLAIASALSISSINLHGAEEQKDPESGEENLRRRNRGISHKVFTPLGRWEEPRELISLEDHLALQKAQEFFKETEKSKLAVAEQDITEKEHLEKPANEQSEDDSSKKGDYHFLGVAHFLARIRLQQESENMRHKQWAVWAKGGF